MNRQTIRKTNRKGNYMSSNHKVIQTFALISQLGFSMIAPILFCIFLGTWLEERYSLPALIPLIIIGVLSGARNAWILAKQAMKDLDDNKKRKRY